MRCQVCCWYSLCPIGPSAACPSDRPSGPCSNPPPPACAVLLPVLLQERRLKDLIKKHSEFISYPISLWTEKTVEKVRRTARLLQPLTTAPSAVHEIRLAPRVPSER